MTIPKEEFKPAISKSEIASLGPGRMPERRVEGWVGSGFGAH